MVRSLGLTCVALIAALLCFTSTDARPLIRNVRTHKEFHKLLKHHKEVTGLPVIIDYFSDGCGPCRQIAPHYKRIAKQYKDTVVFAKIDVNHNRETSGAQQIRSMPTFQFYSSGKKIKQFSGADVAQLENLAKKLSMDFQRNNVKVTMESLTEFYKEYAPEKADEVSLAKVMNKAGGPNGGAGHRKLATALKKKYGKSPVKEVRYNPNAKPDANADEKAKPTPKKPASNSRATKGKPGKTNPIEPNLNIASVPELIEELNKRKKADGKVVQFVDEEKEEDDAVNEDEDDDEDEDDEATRDHFTQWTPNADGFAERAVIVGGGPAGLSAAIYAARAGLRPVVIAPPAGGQLQGKGVLVENYPAVMGATGPHVVYEMMKQAAKFGTRFVDELVGKVDLTKRPFEIHLNDTIIKTHSLILATGADSRWLGVEGEYDYRGGGVSSCATCDGFLYKDRDVVVVGGGDAAMDDALHLARTSSSVTVIHRRDKFRASYILAQRVLTNPKIKVIWNATVDSFVGQTTPEEVDSSIEGSEDIKLEHESAETQATLTHVTVKMNGQEDVIKIACDGAFVAIGHDPNTKFLGAQLEMDTDGYVITKGFTTKTSVAGVFAAGDVADRVYRQAVTSAGSGAMAALDAEHWIDHEGIKDEIAEAEQELLREVIGDGAKSKEL